MINIIDNNIRDTKCSDECWLNRQIMGGGAIQRPRFRHTSAGASSLTQEIVDGHNYILDLVEHMAVFLNLMFYTPLKRKTKFKYFIYYMPLKRKLTSRFTHFQKKTFFQNLCIPQQWWYLGCVLMLLEGENSISWTA